MKRVAALLMAALAWQPAFLADAPAGDTERNPSGVVRRSKNTDFIAERMKKRYGNAKFIQQDLEKHGIVYLHTDKEKYPDKEVYQSIRIEYEPMSSVPPAPKVEPPAPTLPTPPPPTPTPKPVLPEVAKPPVPPSPPPKPVLPEVSKPSAPPPTKPVLPEVAKPSAPPPSKPVLPEVAKPSMPTPPSKPVLPEVAKPSMPTPPKPTVGTDISITTLVERYAAHFAVRPALVYGVIKQESNFDPNAVSPCGARGLMQLLPSTAGDMGVTELFDPEQNVFAGTQYLSRMLKMFNGDERIALAAYNAGPGNVRKWQKRGHEIPPFKETQHYVPTVLKYAGQYAANPPAEMRLAATPRKSRGALPEPVVSVFTLRLKNGYTQPAEVIVQDGEWYYIQIGDVEGRIRRDTVASIVGPV